MSKKTSVNIIRGLGELTNPSNTKQGINIRDIEEQLINGGILTSTQSTTPADDFDNELDDIAGQLGINLDAMSIDAGAADGGDDDDSADGDDADDAGDTADTTHAGLSGSSGSIGSGTARAGSLGSQGTKTEFGIFTDEQRRRSHIDNVIGIEPADNDGSGQYPMNLMSHTYDGDRMLAHGGNRVLSFENERAEDAKYAMLAEISSLIQILEAEESDISRVPTVDINSSPRDVETALKIYRHKCDQIRYCSFANEFIMLGAYGVEALFDGKRTWFGRQPNMTGWSNQVQVKVRRMRHDTSQVVSGLMHDHNIGPITRIALELIPSMLIYGSQNSSRDNTGTDMRNYSADDARRANDNLRDVINR